MAAGHATYSVRIRRAAGDYVIDTVVDGDTKPTEKVSGAGPNALRVAIGSVTRDAKVYAATNNVNVDVELINDVGGGKTMAFTVTPSGERIQSAPTAPRHSAPAAPTTPAAVPQATLRSANGFGTATAFPPRREPRPTPPPPREPDPEPVLAWADRDAGPETDSEEAQSEPAPQLVPVTDKKLRLKNPPRDEDTRRTPAALWEKFKAQSLIKKALIVGAILLLVLLIANILGGGKKEYTAICIDQRTNMRQLDPAPCKTGGVRFFLWWYISSGDPIPEPNTEYDPAHGTFDKPASGTITYS